MCVDSCYKCLSSFCLWKRPSRCRSVGLEVKLLPQEPLKTLCAFPCVTSATLPQRPCYLLCTCVCAHLCLHMFMLVVMWCVCMFTNVCACVCLHMFMPVCVYSHVRVLHGVCACAHHSVCAEGRGQPSVSPVLYHPSPCFLRQFLTESETHSFGQTDCHCVPGSLSPYLVMDAGLTDVCYMFGFYVGAWI